MIFGSRSLKGLRYARVKTKIEEFSIDLARQPEYSFESDDLCLGVVLVLSDAADEIKKGTLTGDTLKDIAFCASFLDAAANEKRHLESKDLLWVLASISYYLCENFGSAQVALGRVENRLCFGVNGKECLDILEYLLTGRRPEGFDYKSLIALSEGKSNDRLRVLSELPGRLKHDSAFDDLFADVAIACVHFSFERMSSALLPMFSGLDVSIWAPMLSSQETGKLLWQAQRRIGEKGAFSGEDVFVQLPTGSGKTKSIELLIKSRIFAGGISKVVIVAPLRALCSEISSDLTTALEGISDVRCASDVMEIDPWIGSKSLLPEVLVFTPEKLSFVFHHSDLSVREVDLFIFDESHLIDSASRGPSYELLLAEIMLNRANAQLVLISAVTSNPGDLASWAFGDASKCTTGEGVASTEKTVGFVRLNDNFEKCRIDFFEYGGSSELDYFVPFKIDVLDLSGEKRKSRERCFPCLSVSAKGKRSRDLALHQTLKLSAGGPVAIYIPQRGDVWKFHARISDLIDLGLDFSPITKRSSADALLKLSNLFALHYGEDCVFAKTVLSGVVPHHGNLQGVIRQVVENDLKRGLLLCISCTSTLAQGVNLPIRYLLVAGKNTGFKKATVRDFQNLIGRTARSGKYSEGSIVVCDVSLEEARSLREYGRLFNAKLVEDCSSAILSLFENVVVWDGRNNRTIDGERIVNLILEHFSDPELEKKLNESLANVFSCEVGVIERKTAPKMVSLKAIENYLASTLENSEFSPDDIKPICSMTYAYHCLNDEKQELFIKLFEAIFDYIDDDGYSNRLAVMAKTQAGVRLSESLSKEIATPEFSSFVANGCEDISYVCSAFLRMCSVEFKWITSEQLSAVAKLWIEGAPLNQMRVELDADHSDLCAVEKIVSGTIGYGLSHFVSQFSDAAEICLGTSAFQEDMLKLQKQLKYGVKKQSEIVFCESVFNDRRLAVKLMEKTGLSDIPTDSLTLKILMKDKSESCVDFLKDYPDYVLTRYLRWVD